MLVILLFFLLIALCLILGGLCLSYKNEAAFWRRQAEEAPRFDWQLHRITACAGVKTESRLPSVVVRPRADDRPGDFIRRLHQTRRLLGEVE